MIVRKEYFMSIVKLRKHPPPRGSRKGRSLYTVLRHRAVSPNNVPEPKQNRVYIPSIGCDCPVNASDLTFRKVGARTGTFRRLVFLRPCLVAPRLAEKGERVLPVSTISLFNKIDDARHASGSPACSCWAWNMSGAHCGVNQMGTGCQSGIVGVGLMWVFKAPYGCLPAPMIREGEEVGVNSSARYFDGL